ncbi:MAG: SCO family protein [Myxococcaceae bacterium]|nr:SCO family protein [Myxococcaceae bacterium]MCA3012235.1 SCO family protein [Myxococcaceae bacterium]
MAKWLALIGVLALLTLGLLVGVRLLGTSRLDRAEALAHQREKTLEPLFPAPAFSYRDHRGALVTPQALAGRPYVANFVFTTCRTICPLLTARMVRLQRALAGVETRFVSFSVDPETDTAEALATYAARWAPDEPRWSLLVTDPQTLPRTAAGFHVTAEAAPSGAPDPIIHSSVFVLVDGAGLVRGVYDSEHARDLEALASAVRRLAAAPPREREPLPAEGVELYHALSCASCHEAQALAPSLFGRAGSRVELETGLVTTFDAAYVKESLLAPDAKRAKGYPLRMPASDELDAAALDTLVRYVLEAPAAAAPAAADVQVAVDPVCHMQVRVTADALSADRAGRRTYFCSKHCLKRFEATPGAFVANDGGR